MNNNKKTYKCDRCLKTFNQVSNFKRHINRKFKCKEIIEYIEDKEEDIHVMSNEELIGMIKLLQIENKQLINEVNNLKLLIKKNDYKANINDNYVVNYGEENVNSIGIQNIKNILSSGELSVKKYIKYMHFNQDLPIYRNIIMSDIDRRKIHFINNDKWYVTTLKIDDNILLLKVGQKLDLLYKAYVTNNIIKLSNNEDYIIRDIIDILLYKCYDPSYKGETKCLKKFIYESLYNNYKNYEFI